MVITDYNKMKLHELITINKKLEIEFIINNGIISGASKGKGNNYARMYNNFFRGIQKFT